MAPKKSQANAAPVVTTGTTTTTVPAVSAPAKKPSSDAWSNVVSNILSHYQKTTPQRTKLIDLFMVFLVLVGGLQFAYCVLAGNYVRRCSLPSIGYRVFYLCSDVVLSGEVDTTKR